MNDELLSVLRGTLGDGKLSTTIYTSLVNASAADDKVSKGMVLLGLPGCGKSTLLRSISACFPPTICQCYDSNSNGFALSNSCKIVLVDDVDQWEDCTSLVNAIDNVISSRYFLCTCKSIEGLDKRLIQVYRLGSPVTIPVLHTSTRTELFSQFLGVLDDDSSTSSSDMAFKLAVATRNASLSDIMKLSRDVFHSEFGGVETLASQCEGGLLTSSSSNHEVSSLLTQIDAIPDLVNLKKIQCHLLKSIYAPYINRGSSTLTAGLQRPTSGFVIHGTSGTGKSALVQWLAGVTRKHFKLVSVSCSDLVHKVVGQTEKYISKVFAYARSVGPTFLWLDNLDSILPSRSNEESEGGGRRGQRTSQKTMDRLLSTLLVEIDGLGNYHKNNNQESGQENIFESSSVVVIVTVNRLESIDRSLLRPGRLEEHIELSLPNQRQRTTFLKHLFGCEVQSAQLDQLSGICEGSSYAEMKELHQSAEFSYFKEGMKSRTEGNEVVEEKERFINRWIEERI